jgi:large subunit ribosomal protein L15
MPQRRRVAKRGFSNNFSATKVAIINLSTLEGLFESGATVDIDALKSAGLLKKAYDEVKVLGNGNLTKKLTVKVHRFSQSALDKIAAAGGRAEVV